MVLASVPKVISPPHHGFLPTAPATAKTSRRTSFVIHHALTDSRLLTALKVAVESMLTHGTTTWRSPITGSLETPALSQAESPSVRENLPMASLTPGAFSCHSCMT